MTTTGSRSPTSGSPTAATRSRLRSAASTPSGRTTTFPPRASAWRVTAGGAAESYHDWGKNPWVDASAAPDLQFAFAVSAFADLLRGQDDAKRWSLEAIEQVARATAGDDPDRGELVSLIEKARQLRGSAATVAR